MYISELNRRKKMKAYYKGPTKEFSKDEFIARVKEKAANAPLTGSEKQIAWARDIQIYMIEDAIEKIDAIPDGEASGGFYADEYKLALIALFPKVQTRDLIDDRTACANTLFTTVRDMMYKRPQDFTPKPLVK